MSRRYLTAIRHGIKETLAPIKRRMESDREPQAARAAQRETKEKSDQSRGQSPNPCFSRIVQMECAEDERKQSSRRPESHAPRQRELRVAAQQEFLEEPHPQK